MYAFLFCALSLQMEVSFCSDFYTEKLFWGNSVYPPLMGLKCLFDCFWMEGFLHTLWLVTYFISSVKKDRSMGKVTAEDQPHGNTHCRDSKFFSSTSSIATRHNRGWDLAPVVGESVWGWGRCHIVYCLQRLMNLKSV